MKGSGVHKSKLTIVFSRNLVCFIMVPILAFIFGAMVIIRNLMLEDAYDKVTLAQQNVVGTLSAEIRDVSIRLSHFLLTNNRQALRLAEDATHMSGTERYKAYSALQESYNFAVTPTSNTIAIHFYTQGGQVVAMKDDAVLPVSEIREFDFYKEALDHPEECHVGLIPASVTYQALRSDSTRKAIAVAFAPADFSGGDNIEVVCWYANTAVSRMIQDYSRDNPQGEMYLIDEQGNALIGQAEASDAPELPEWIVRAASGRYNAPENGGRLNYLVMGVPDTPWKIVNVVDQTVLLEDFNRVMYLVMALSVMVIILFAIYSGVFLRNIIRPMTRLIKGMRLVENGDLDVTLELTGKDEVRALIGSFNSMVQRMKALIESNRQQQAEMHRAEMDALQSQINPHFLMNTLSSIQFLAMLANYDNIRKMTGALMKILESSFKWDDGPCHIRDEINLLKSYLYLMKIRYPESFEVRWDLDEGCMDYGVPRLILQPIFENAIIHGFEDKKEPGTVTISTREKEDVIEFVVADNGKGMEQVLITALLREEPGKQAEDDPKTPGGALSKSSSRTSGKRGIGVTNVHRRLQLYFGPEYGIRIESTVGEGSRVILTIPKLTLGD